MRVFPLLIRIQRGNPLGGLVYSNGFASNGGNNNSFQQVIEWHKYVYPCVSHDAQQLTGRIQLHGLGHILLQGL